MCWIRKLNELFSQWERAASCRRVSNAVRWRIYQEADVPFGIAGIYRRWKDPLGGPALFTFAMLTVNADTHPFYKRFHKPGEEKRMPIFLDKDHTGRGCNAASSTHRCSSSTIPGRSLRRPRRSPGHRKSRPSRGRRMNCCRRSRSRCPRRRLKATCSEAHRVSRRAR